MEKKNRTKRGFTLAELSVVLAVLMVASALVATFTVMARRSQSQSAAKGELLADIGLAESLIEGFLQSGGPASVSADGSKLLQGDGALYYADGQLVTPNTAAVLEHITDIHFASLVDDGTGDTIYFCTLSYGEGQAYTFCVDPYVGEQLGGGL